MESKTKVAPVKQQSLSWWEKILIAIIPPLIAGGIKLLCLSYRIVHVENNHGDLSIHGGRAVYCTWHQRMFYHFHYFGKLHVTMMISRSKDGEWAAKIAHSLGFKNVRGSSRKGTTDKGGKKAMYKLIDMVNQGESAGILVDGPRGPARTVKMGAIIIAQKTGAPLLSEMWSCDRAWILNSWDRYIIPKPFAKVYISQGKPIYVPKKASSSELEEIRQQLEQRMQEDVQRCDAYFSASWPTER